MHSVVDVFLHIEHAVSQPRQAAASACHKNMCVFCQKRGLSAHAWLCATYPGLSLYVIREEPPMCIGVYAYTRLCLGIYIYIERERFINRTICTCRHSPRGLWLAVSRCLSRHRYGHRSFLLRVRACPDMLSMLVHCIWCTQTHNA